MFAEGNAAFSAGTISRVAPETSDGAVPNEHRQASAALRLRRQAARMISPSPFSHLVLISVHISIAISEQT